MRRSPFRSRRFGFQLPSHTVDRTTTPSRLEGHDVDEWFFDDGWNHDDPTNMQRVVLVCGTLTLPRLLHMAGVRGLKARVAAGGIVPIVFPIGCKPSVSIGMGTFADRAQLWAIASREEWAALLEDESESTYNPECEKKTVADISASGVHTARAKRSRVDPTLL